MMMHTRDMLQQANKASARQLRLACLDMTNNSHASQSLQYANFADFARSSFNFPLLNDVRLLTFSFPKHPLSLCVSHPGDTGV
jgi:hypothetical protein